MTRSIRRASLAALFTLLAAAALAHEVPVEQRIEMSMQRQGDRLVVRMRIPIALLGDAPIGPAAGDVVRNLDVRQHDVPLAAPSMAAVRGADRTSADVELTYRINADTAGISARLNGFQTPPMQPVRTTVTYLPADRRAQTLSVLGPATRVLFEPTAMDVVQDFLARSLRTVLAVGDHVLMLACLLLTRRSGRDALRLFGSLAAGQAIGMAAFGFGTELTPAFSTAAAMTAASALVMTAVQTMVGARTVYVKALAVAFGVVNGIAFAATFAAGRQFGGAHSTLALAVFLGVMIAAELWLGAVMWATRAWIDRRGAPHWAFTIVAAAFVAHTGVHEVIDRADALAIDGTLAAGRALLWLTVAWAVVMLIVAALEWLRALRSPAYSTTS